MLRNNVIRQPLMLLLPALLLTACAGKSPCSLPTSGVPAL
ncbi:putative lipoprotein [Burkholderia pseudomallei MSHR7498]|nr:putative lipoprotein [Burkholderia pseudomallei MSHR1153]KGS95090.1 putative lipoprotein [Burkholderia pseudomallei MSHR7498]